MYKYSFYIFIFISLSYKIYSQSFAGRVLDENKQPLMGVAVYFDGTTLGVITNRNGDFSIKIPSDIYKPKLIISYIGYKKLVVENFSEDGKIYELEKSINALDQVQIYDSPFSREEMFKAFRTYFLGSGIAARKSKILNPDDIILYFLRKNNTLHAKAFQPIIIENNYLGYKISFDLKKFDVKFITESLNNLDMEKSYYAGYSYFTNIDQKKNKKRERVYEKSLEKFFKSLIEKNSQYHNFYVYHDRLLREPEYIFDIQRMENNLYKIALKPEVIHYIDGNYYPTEIILKYINMVSILKFQKVYCTVDQFGHIVDGKDFVISGDHAEHRVARMLPTNFSKN
jgi:hypothetical protein